MSDNVIHMSDLATNIRNIFDKSKLTTAMVHAKENINGDNDSIKLLLEKIDTYMEKSFFNDYFKALITSIDLSICREVDIDGQMVIMYNLRLPLTVHSTLLIYELDIGLSYLYAKLREDTYKEIINKILKPFNLRAFNHSVICISSQMMYEIVVDVILTKGELFDYLIGLKDDKLRNGDGIYEEDCDDDRIE